MFGCKLIALYTGMLAFFFVMVIPVKSQENRNIEYAWYAHQRVLGSMIIDTVSNQFTYFWRIGSTDGIIFGKVQWIGRKRLKLSTDSSRVPAYPEIELDGLVRKGIPEKERDHLRFEDEIWRVYKNKLIRPRVVDGFFEPKRMIHYRRINKYE